MASLRIRLFVLSLAVATLTGVACGGSPAAPAAPAGPASVGPPAMVAGTWRGTITLKSATGGECFAQQWADAVSGAPYGLFPFTITQDGSNLTATNLVAFPFGSTCSYTGTAGANTFTLNGTSCPSRIAFACPDGRTARDISFVSAVWSASVNGDTASGQDAEVWNVLVSGTSTVVGTVTFTSSFALNRQ